MILSIPSLFYTIKSIFFVITLSLLISLESRATLNEGDDFEERSSISERLDDSDYSEDDPHAVFLNQKHIQERRINHGIENITSFIKRPEEEIESVMRVALPIITTKRINGTDHPGVQCVCGRLCAKIVNALSNVPAKDRENIAGIAELFYKGEKDHRFPDAFLPHIIKALSNVSKGNRKSVVKLTYPFYRLCIKNDGFGFSNDYSARILTAISNIPPEDRENVMEKITPKITKILTFLTKNCVFRTYSDGGDNGKRKNQHAEMIETIASVPTDDRTSVLDYTFNQEYIPCKKRTYKDPGSGRTRYLERSYADIDEIVLEKMKALKEIAADERSDVLEKAKLLITEDMPDAYPVQILKALSKFSRDQRDTAILDALLRKKRDEDFLPLLIALSEVPEDQRSNVWKAFESLNKKLMSNYSAYTSSNIIRTLAKIPEYQRNNVIDYSLFFLLSSKKDKVFDDHSTLMEIISQVPGEEILDVLEKFKVLFNKKSMNISDCAQIIQTLAKVPKEQRKSAVKTLAQPFLIALKESGSTYSYQTPWGNHISACSWAKLLKSLSNVAADERDDVLKKAALLVNKEISRDEYSKIIEVLSKIPHEERARLVANDFLKKRSVHDHVDLLTALSKIPEDQRTDVLAAFEILINQKFIKSHSGFHDAKTIDTLAKIPEKQRRNVIIASLPLLISNDEKSYGYENLDGKNLKIIESVAEIPEKERTDVIFQTLHLCTEAQNSRSLIITPVYSALQISMPSNPRSIVISSLAKVRAEERNNLIKLVSKFQIKKYGDSYTALIIKEIASMSLEKREHALIASDLGEKQHIIYNTEESRKALRNGFEPYTEYLLKSTFSELFRLKIISAVSGIPQDYKRKISKYMEPVFINMPESYVGDILIGIGHNLSQINLANDKNKN